MSNQEQIELGDRQPSNAKETPIGVLNTARHDAIRENTFNAIMADLGKPTEVGQYKEPMLININWVESVLRRHLGIPHPSSLIPE